MVEEAPDRLVWGGCVGRATNLIVADEVDLAREFARELRERPGGLEGVVDAPEKHILEGEHPPSRLGIVREG